MTRRSRLRAGTASDDTGLPGEVDLESWPVVDEHALSGPRRDLYRRRAQAIRLYLEGASTARIKEACGIGRGQAYRLLTERCLKQHPDGRVYGWRGALAHERVKAYTRSAPLQLNNWGGGAVGALQWVFESPGGLGLEARLRDRILRKRGELESSRRPRLAVFRWFLGELRERGFERRGEWPFNVEKRGYVTLCRYIDRVLTDHPERQRQLAGGEDAMRKARAGDGTRRPALQLFERVECDAHKLDARMVVLVPSPHGGTEPRVIHRLWVVALIEVASRAVLGYHLSLRRECSAEDVLRAVRCALTEWTPRTLQFSGDAYVPGAGLPSYRSAQFVGACWNEFSVDGALANVCARVEGTLHDVVGATLIKPQDPASYSCRRSKDDRPFIESFFGRLAAGGFHQLTTTTGSSPADKRGADPGQTALATHFQLEYAEELLDTLIANYNATPHTGLGYRAPLDQLELLAATRSEPLRMVDSAAVRRMVGVRKLCTLLGGVRTGRRAHFNFANARYSAEWLCLRNDLLGKNLWLHVENEDDARFVSVSTQQGLFLGVVRAGPPWHRTPHSLYVRQAIRALDKRRLLHLSANCDAVEALLRYAESSPGQKLPVHPAYLEARRILQQHAEALTGQSMVTLARASTQTETKEVSGVGVGVGNVTPFPTETRTADARALPPMRKAQQW
ncbi:helix-turn-helix domain-containing protein [Paraburkholderia fungorum]|uniref:helix-turn-helix domain-containing protein n=1 Tax=Paraburkholderia fungorum TaxID=134537 RepID=UPI00402B7E83